ncbi:hypothetical protein MB27_34110 [Actinoplanes utahensis]|uniref:Uncharacterized protein n=1 Tax=Actinoplanes utahensis TaxID=1869 RepID=A0A0A6UDJ1_ACTUT|nr:hypothetical protein MB27_34110 [Actinoplanes utahensis]
MLVSLLVTAVAGCDDGVPAVTPSRPPPATVADPQMIKDLPSYLDIPDPRPARFTTGLNGPTHRVHVVETATANLLGDDFLPWFKTDANPEPVGPATTFPGNEFLFVRLSGVAGETHHVMFPSPLIEDKRVRIQVGDQTRDMPQVIGAEALLLMVVPTGAPVRLQVTEAGRSSSMDLRTGEPDAAGAAAGAGSRKGEAEWDVYGQYPGDAIGSQVNVKATVTLDSFDGTWAPPGRMWLRIGLKLSYWSWRDLGGKLDAARSIRVEVGGRAVDVAAESTAFTRLTRGTPNIYQNDLYAKVQVPKDGVRKVGVRFSPAGPITLDGRSTTFRATSVPTGTVTLK